MAFSILNSEFIKKLYIAYNNLGNWSKEQESMDGSEEMGGRGSGLIAQPGRRPKKLASLTKQKTIQSRLKIPNHKFQITNKSQHAAQTPALRVNKIQYSKLVWDIGYLNLRFIWNLVLDI